MCFTGVVYAAADLNRRRQLQKRHRPRLRGDARLRGAGAVSAIFSPAPILTLYKAGLFFTDAVLLVFVMTTFRNRPNTAMLLDTTYVLVSLFAWGALLGALIRPDWALRPLGGALGFILEGTMPYLNPNELGFLGAITFLVGIRRVFEKANFGLRFFYFSQAFMGFVVVFLAQSRTSLAAVMVGLIFMAVSVRRMRVLVASIVCVGILGLVIFSSAKERQVAAESIQGNVMAYAERGHELTKTLDGRYYGWMIGLDMLKDAPMLGHGFDMGVRHKGVLYGFPDMSHMHNSHFQVLVNSGVVGYALWLMMFLPPMFMAFRSYGGAFSGNTLLERYQVELFAVMLLIALRSITGQILVTHQWSLLVFLGAYVHLRLGWATAPILPIRQRTPTNGTSTGRAPQRAAPVNQLPYGRPGP
jgi:O-antigen ligase